MKRKASETDNLRPYHIPIMISIATIVGMGFYFIMSWVTAPLMKTAYDPGFLSFMVRAGSFFLSVYTAYLCGEYFSQAPK